MENNSQENALFDRMPLAAMHIRTALGNIYYAAQRLAPPEARDNDPELDKTAAVLYQGYYRLLRLAKDLESLGLLQRQQPLPVENTDLKVWLDELVQEATVPFQLKGVTLKMLCPERYVVTAVEPHWLGQAVWHLLSNALCACADGGHVTVKLTVQQPNVLLEITDDGCGIPAAHAPEGAGISDGRSGRGTAAVVPRGAAPRRSAPAGQPGGRGHHRHAGAAPAPGGQPDQRQRVPVHGRLPAFPAGAVHGTARHGVPDPPSG